MCLRSAPLVVRGARREAVYVCVCGRSALLALRKKGEADAPPSVRTPAYLNKTHLFKTRIKKRGKHSVTVAARAGGLLLSSSPSPAKGKCV